MAGKREAGTRELITWVGTRAPIPNTLVPSAPRCVGLADLSVMPAEESERTVAPIPIPKLVTAAAFLAVLPTD